MRIDVHDQHRRLLCRIDVDLRQPPSVVRPTHASNAPTGDIYLDWEKAIDDQGYLRHCPVCSCRELFVRKDFPQVTGLLLVVLVAVVAMVLFAADRVLWGVTLLVIVALVDATIYFFTGRCLVCYRCRSEFRNLPIRREHPGWELAVGEKYRAATTPDAAPHLHAELGEEKRGE